ncbi:HpcH/HpaI aldolase family protein [Aspergillus puulaauensis]|uniref:HpcH/HpaI aldolase/citrate lyase domain-containing protein n=1 Tax=Aspergillus puulaauensis TaxID=1220207 RepID=A0A7R8AH43_9EURO|nr:uncharacterized protein APUU_10028S [Aspergillus puulaauensis]BCS17200.1 hypothetical protein APUU_10028S [Aspergillus puulaauensis]
MAPIYSNNLYQPRDRSNICKAAGVKVVPSVAVVQIAQKAGFDALFIDMEHSTLSIYNVSQLCTAGLLAGITPLVRVPHQCGNGMVQKVLDGGAMGVIFPHIDSRSDAEAAVSISKYPPWGKRSMTGQLPQFSMVTRPVQQVVDESNANGSAVIVMMETGLSLENADTIASTPGVDVLLVGSSDLCIDLGISGQFESDQFRAALETVNNSCKNHKKLFGIAGIYEDSSTLSWAIKNLDVRFMLGQYDASIVSKGFKQCAESMKQLERL